MLEYTPRHANLASKLSISLSRCGLTPPPETALATELAAWFGADDLDLAEAMSRGQPPDWHVVEMNPSWLPPEYGGEVLATSREEALAFLLAIVDEYRVHPDSVAIEGDVLVLRESQKKLFLLRPASFESVDRAGHARAARCLKGVRAGDAVERLATRLSGLPGLSGIKPRPRHPDLPVRQGGAVPFPPTWPVFLRKALLTLGLPVPLHQAQELVAEMLGFRLWQVVAASWAETVWARPARVLCRQHALGYFRTVADAIWAFAQVCERAPNVVVDVAVEHGEAGLDMRAAIPEEGDSVTPLAQLFISPVTFVKDPRYLSLAKDAWRPVLGGVWGTILAKGAQRSAVMEVGDCQFYLDLADPDHKRMVAVRRSLSGKPRSSYFTGLLLPSAAEPLPESGALDPDEVAFRDTVRAHETEIRKFAEMYMPGAYVHWSAHGVGTKFVVPPEDFRLSDVSCTSRVYALLRHAAPLLHFRKTDR